MTGRENSNWVRNSLYLSPKNWFSWHTLCGAHFCAMVNTSQHAWNSTNGQTLTSNRRFHLLSWSEFMSKWHSHSSNLSEWILLRISKECDLYCEKNSWSITLTNYAMFFLFQFVTLCSFCGPIDGVSSLSYVCNYQPSDDCKNYDDIKHGSCMDCT